MISDLQIYAVEASRKAVGKIVGDLWYQLRTNDMTHAIQNNIQFSHLSHDQGAWWNKNVRYMYYWLLVGI